VTRVLVCEDEHAPRNALCDLIGEIRSTAAEVRGQSEGRMAALPESRHPMEVDLDPAGRRERGSEDRLATLLESAPNRVVITDEDGRIVAPQAGMAVELWIPAHREAEAMPA
jgi:PAS domain-containing protein